MQAVGEVWTPRGMTVKKFFEMSTGEWKCLRSSHNIAFGMVEEVILLPPFPSHQPISFSLSLWVASAAGISRLCIVQVNTEMTIVDLEVTDPEVLDMCQNNNADPAKAIYASK